MPGIWGCPGKKVLLERAPTRGQFNLRLFSCPAVHRKTQHPRFSQGQIDQDREDGRAVEKVQGPVSTAGTAPHEGSVRGRGANDSSAPRGHGAVAGISPFCGCLNLWCWFCFVYFLFLSLFLGIRCCGV